MPARNARRQKLVGAYLAKGMFLKGIRTIPPLWGSVRIHNFKVKPRTDVAIYKDESSSINQIADDLEVDYIVEGSVRIAGEKLRVNAKKETKKELQKQTERPREALSHLYEEGASVHQSVFPFARRLL